MKSRGIEALRISRAAANELVQARLFLLRRASLNLPYECRFAVEIGVDMRRIKEYNRKYSRVHMPFTIKILTYNYKRLDPDYCTIAEGVNISPGGLSFKYPKVLFNGDHMRVLIREIKGLKREEIFANVRIIWSETRDILSKKFGAKFMKITPDKKYRLMKLLKNNGGR